MRLRQIPYRSATRLVLSSSVPFLLDQRTATPECLTRIARVADVRHSRRNHVSERHPGYRDRWRPLANLITLLVGKLEADSKIHDVQMPPAVAAHESRCTSRALGFPQTLFCESVSDPALVALVSGDQRPLKRRLK